MQKQHTVSTAEFLAQALPLLKAAGAGSAHVMSVARCQVSLELVSVQDKFGRELQLTLDRERQVVNGQLDAVTLPSQALPYPDDQFGNEFWEALWRALPPLQMRSQAA